MTKAVAFNCSPRMDKGNTALVLNPFLEGMKEAGAEVELFQVKKLKIKPCLGCLSCWIQTPGECVQRDDMSKILPSLRSDIWVFATPVYVDGMSAGMKILLERFLPGVQPFVETREGHLRHLHRKDYKLGQKTVLVSTCGFWELDNFHPLLVHMEAICKNMGREFTGALLRPTGPVLKAMMEQGAQVEDVLEAAREAGRQLVSKGRMFPETLEAVRRELLPRETFEQVINQMFHQKIEAAERKKRPPA